MSDKRLLQLPAMKFAVLLLLLALALLLPLVAHAAVASSKLTAVTGQGSGKMIIAPTARGHGHFTAQMTLNVHHTSPNTTFWVSRAPDFNPDGVCTGTRYVPFTVSPTNPEAVSLTTSPGGAGAAHWSYEATQFPSGMRFDVVVRAVGEDGTIVQSECMTITVK